MSGSKMQVKVKIRQMKTMRTIMYHVNLVLSERIFTNPVSNRLLTFLIMPFFFKERLANVAFGVIVIATTYTICNANTEDV